jgi:hypothetical protein
MGCSSRKERKKNKRMVKSRGKKARANIYNTNFRPLALEKWLKSPILIANCGM